MTQANAIKLCLARVKVSFLEKLILREKRLVQLVSVLRLSMSRHERAAAITECIEILHKLAGVAGTVGLHNIGEGARCCEEAIRSNLDEEVRLNEPAHEMLDRFIGDIAAMPELQEHITARLKRW